MDKGGLEKRWDELFANFNILKSYFNNLEENASLAIFDVQYPKFLELEVSFTKLIYEIERYNELNPINPISLENRYWFVSLIKDIKKKYWNAQKIHLETSPITDESNLPDIPICVFDGSIEKWPEFETLFNTLVHHNYNVPKKSKMQYLKRYVTGEAAEIISEFSIAEENYVPAYDKFQKLYNGFRYRGQHYLRTILKYNEDHFDKKRYLEIHENAVQSLRAMILPDFAECLLFYIAYNNLDKDTQKKFDTKYCSGTCIPTTKQLFDFVKGCELTVEIGPPDIITLD